MTIRSRMGASASGTPRVPPGSGSQGSQGQQGFQGAQGFQGGGAQGAQGSTGPQGSGGGAQGAQGATGTQGFQGAQGFQGGGFQGAQGAQGATGTQGFQGAQGNQGQQGQQGAQGFQGATGTQGAQGAQGAQGFQGSQGAQGFQGAVGAQGSQGAQGFQGMLLPSASTGQLLYFDGLVWNHTNGVLAGTNLLSIGPAPSSAGQLRLSASQSGIAQVTSRNFAGTGDLLVYSGSTTSADNQNFGDLTTAGRTTIGGGAQVTLTIGGGLSMTLSGISITTQFTSLIFGAANSLVGPADLNTASGTGTTFTVHGQNMSGVTSTGGQLILASGTGTTIAGTISLNFGATPIVTVTGSGIAVAGQVVANASTDQFVANVATASIRLGLVAGSGAGSAASGTASIRGSSTFAINVRNAGDNANANVFSYTGSTNLITIGENTANVTSVVLSSSGSVALKSAGVTVLQLAIASSDFVTFGAAPAATGNIRLPFGANTVMMRNVTNTADLAVYGSDPVINQQNFGDVNSSNLNLLGGGLTFGDPTSTRRLSLSSTLFQVNVVTWEFPITLSGAAALIRYADNTTSVTGASLSVRAQDNTFAAGVGGQMNVHGGDASGTGATVGGKALLRSGTGATAGALEVRAGALTIFDWGVTTANVTTVNGASQVNLAVAGTSKISIFASFAQLQVDLAFAKATPVISPIDDATAGATGTLFTIRGQNETGTGATVGGKLLIASGTGNTAGNLELRVGAKTVFDYGVTNATTLTVGESTIPLILNGAGGASAMVFELGGVGQLQIFTTQIQCVPGKFYFTSTGQVSPLPISTNSATGVVMTFSGQDCSGTTTIGGATLVRGGTGTTRNGNVHFHAQAANDQAMGNGIFIGNASSTPTGNPASGGFLYSTAGALHWLGSSGTNTTLGPAEPHCPECGRDFALEWQHEDKDEHLAVCLPCLIGTLRKSGHDHKKFAFVHKLKGAA